jgi:hypothetical protein
MYGAPSLRWMSPELALSWQTATSPPASALGGESRLDVAGNDRDLMRCASASASRTDAAFRNP